VTFDELREGVTEGRIDTVLLATTDIQGRLQGKRLTATHVRAGGHERGGAAVSATEH